MDELVRWLGEQLDEDERIARSSTPGPWWHNPEKQWLGPEAFEKYDLWQGEEFVGYGGPHPFTGAVCSTGPASNMQAMKDAAHIATHDPARVLREIEAKRRILDASNDGCSAGCRTEHTFSGSCGLRPMGPPWDTDGQRWVRDADGAKVVAPPVTPGHVLRLLALPYADRPGYREEWRP